MKTVKFSVWMLTALLEGKGGMVTALSQRQAQHRRLVQLEGQATTSDIDGDHVLSLLSLGSTIELSKSSNAGDSEDVDI